MSPCPRVSLSSHLPISPSSHPRVPASPRLAFFPSPDLPIPASPCHRVTASRFLPIPPSLFHEGSSRNDEHVAPGRMPGSDFIQGSKNNQSQGAGHGSQDLGPTGKPPEQGDSPDFFHQQVPPRQGDHCRIIEFECMIRGNFPDVRAGNFPPQKALRESVQLFAQKATQTLEITRATRYGGSARLTPGPRR